jgi:hypothetical protein
MMMVGVVALEADHILDLIRSRSRHFFFGGGEGFLSGMSFLFCFFFLLTIFRERPILSISGFQNSLTWGS